MRNEISSACMHWIVKLIQVFHYVHNTFHLLIFMTDTSVLLNEGLIFITGIQKMSEIVMKIVTSSGQEESHSSHCFNLSL